MTGFSSNSRLRDLHQWSLWPAELYDIDTDDTTSKSSLTSLKESVAVVVQYTCVYLVFSIHIIVASFCSYSKKHYSITGSTGITNTGITGATGCTGISGITNTGITGGTGITSITGISDFSVTCDFQELKKITETRVCPQPLIFYFIKTQQIALFMQMSRVTT